MPDDLNLLDLLMGAAAKTRRMLPPPPPPPRAQGECVPPPPPPHLGFGRILKALSQTDGLTPTALAEQLGLRLPTLSESLKKLEERGLVARVPVPENKKSSYITLTDAGREEARRLAGKAAAFAETFFSPLTQEEKTSLEAILTKLNEGRDIL